MQPRIWCISAETSLIINWLTPKTKKIEFRIERNIRLGQAETFPWFGFSEWLPKSYGLSDCFSKFQFENSVVTVLVQKFIDDSMYKHKRFTWLVRKFSYDQA